MNTNLSREQRIFNVAAGQTVEELKGRHAYLHGVNFGREEYGVFWLRSTDTTWGHGWGRLIGYDEMFKAHCGAAADEMFGSARFTGWFGHEMDGHDRRSTNWGASHVLASPVIEVADDPELVPHPRHHDEPLRPGRQAPLRRLALGALRFGLCLSRWQVVVGP